MLIYLAGSNSNHIIVCYPSLKSLTVQNKYKTQEKAFYFGWLIFLDYYYALSYG